jgi:hypothetical protein
LDAPAPARDSATGGGMSKSTKRKRAIARVTWLDAAEDAMLETKRKAAGVSRAELMRMALFNYKPPRSADHTNALARLSGELGKIGSNLNQIAHHLNAGRPGDRIEGALDSALRELYEWRTVLMQALGYDRNRKPRDRD